MAPGYHAWKWAVYRTTPNQSGVFAHRRVCLVAILLFLFSCFLTSVQAKLWRQSMPAPRRNTGNPHPGADIMLLDRFAILISAPVNRFAAVRKALTVDERWSIPRRLVAALLCTLLTLIPALASAQGAVAAEKLTVLMVPLVPQGENPAPAQQLAGSIGAGLQQSGRYTVKEPPGSHATCPDEACAVQAGKSLGVAKVVAVRVNEVQANVWHASAQLMDVSTGAVEATDVADHTGTLPGLLTVQSAAMVDRLTTRVADPAVPRATSAVAAEP